MIIERGMGWFRSRGALICATAALVLSIAYGWLDRAGCEYRQYPDGITLPLNLPFELQTHEQRVVYSSLLQGMSWLGPLLSGTTLVLLAGVLWAHAVSQLRVAFALVLVPLLAALLNLLTVALHAFSTTSEDLTLSYFDLLLLVEDSASRAVQLSIGVVLVGLIALVVRALRSPPEPERTGV